MADESAFERKFWTFSEFGYLLEEKKEIPHNMKDASLERRSILVILLITLLEGLDLNS